MTVSKQPYLVNLLFTPLRKINDIDIDMDIVIDLDIDIEFDNCIDIDIFTDICIWNLIEGTLKQDHQRIMVDPILLIV